MDTLTDKAFRWLRQHTASERSFDRVLREFFQAQAARVAREAAATHGLSHDLVPLIFNAEAEHGELMPIVRRNVTAMMVAGAKAELETLERARRARKQIDDVDPFSSDYMEAFSLDAHDLGQLFWEAVPPSVQQAIRHAVDESMSQPYWRSVTDGVASDIGTLIKESIDNGDSVPTLAKRIREQLGGDFARSRAASIATTETTCALNSGHYEALNDIAASDMVLGREWLAVGDKLTRTTHLNANGQKVAKGAPFIIGGYECRYPGDVTLPASERVRCRCTCIGVIAV